MPRSALGKLQRYRVAPRATPQAGARGLSARAGRHVACCRASVMRLASLFPCALALSASACRCASGDPGFAEDGSPSGDQPDASAPCLPPACDCTDCEESCFGPSDGCDGWGEGASNLVTTAEGWLELDGFAESLHVIWPSSSGRGDVFKIDTRTRAIEGAYWTGPNHGDAVRLVGDSPSRSAVADS